MNGVHMRRFRNIPPLQYLLGFEAAERLKSFSKAEGELGISQSTVSHKMRLLEDRVGPELVPPPVLFRRFFVQTLPVIFLPVWNGGAGYFENRWCL
jgi:Bacterial regulatory helix-turn-helix protein, lysR family